MTEIKIVFAQKSVLRGYQINIVFAGNKAI